MPGGVTASANPPTQGSKYRIKVGQTIGGLCWSNSATTIQGFFTLLYDDGSPDYWPIVQSASGSSRAAVNWSTGQIAKKNGWVVGGLVGGGGSFQRGQLYHQAFIVDTNLIVVSDVIACGYAYAGHVVSLGTFVEPGPAGGHGNTRSQTLTQPAVGTDYAIVVIPTGALWRAVGFHGQLVAAVAAANRELVIKVTTSTPNDIAGCVASEIQTSGQTQDYYGARGINSTGASAGVGAGAIQIGLPDGAFDSSQAGGRFVFVTFNINAGDQWSAGQLYIEEWVVPN